MTPIANELDVVQSGMLTNAWNKLASIYTLMRARLVQVPEIVIFAMDKENLLLIEPEVNVKVVELLET